MYKLPNFGSTVRAIDAVLPHLLHKTMPEHLVHKNITFNLLPEQHNLSFHGSRVYHTIQVLLQVAITPWLLPTGTQLSILSRRTTEDKEISDRKYIVNWRSVLPEGTPTNDDPCDQHSNPATPGHLGHLGSLGHLGPQKFQQFQESTPTFLSNTEMTRKTGLQMDLDLPTDAVLKSQSFSLPGKLIQSLGLLPHEYPCMAGTFEFQFDSECQTVLVHTVRNVEYIARRPCESVRIAT